MLKSFLFLIFINLLVYSQTYQSYLPYGYDIKTCKFFGENIGYYILNGLVYKTTNSGDDWNVIYKSNEKNFLRTAFLDKNNFWIVTNTNIIHSKDGGLTFDILTKPGNIEDISFCDSLYGWALVGNYSLYKTTNGGITWNFIYTANYARNVQLLTRTVGYISDYPHLLKTTNGGNDFYSVFSAMAMIYFNFASPDTGMANYFFNSDWEIYTTTTGGNSWTQREGIVGGHVDYTDYFNTTIVITGMYYPNNAFLWVSTDTGNSWMKNNGKYFREISLINENLIYGIDNISLNKITNLGSEWHRCPIIPPITFSKIKGNENSEWIIGSNFNSDSNKTFSYLFEKNLEKIYSLKTTWNNCEFTSLYLNQNLLAFIGGIDKPSNNNFILKTLDLGRTWTKSNLVFEGSVNEFCQLNDIVFLGAGNNGLLVKSTDAGNSWEQIDMQTNVNFNTIVVKDSLLLIGGDEATIFRSTNFGNSWERIILSFSNSIKSISIQNSLKIWAAGTDGLIMLTTDKGLTWQDLTRSDHDYESINVTDSYGVIGGKDKVNQRALWGLNIGSNNINDWVFFSDTLGSIHAVFTRENQIRLAGEGGNLFGFPIDSYLPVEIASFSGTVSNKEVKLLWTTSSEINNLGFEIQKSYKDKMWHTVGFMEGKGNSTEINDYSFKDDISDFNLTGEIFYRLKQIDFNGTFEYSNEISVEVYSPDRFVLDQNYPNPFNPGTMISYSIPHSSFVTLKVYDVLGNEVVILVNETKSAGKYDVNFNAANLSNGVYFYTIKTDDFTYTKKMLLLK